jgi:hypothetical protein
MRILVCVGDRVVDLVDSAMAERMAKAPNAKAVRARKTGAIARIILKNHGDDSSLVEHRGNPRRYSHDHETEQNPARCWTLRHLPAEANPSLKLLDMIST